MAIIKALSKWRGEGVRDGNSARNGNELGECAERWRRNESVYYQILEVVVGVVD